MLHLGNLSENQTRSFLYLLENLKSLVRHKELDLHRVADG